MLDPSKNRFEALWLWTKKNRLMVLWTCACIGLLAERFFQDWNQMRYINNRLELLVALALETAALWVLVLVGVAVARYLQRREP